MGKTREEILAEAQELLSMYAAIASDIRAGRGSGDFSPEYIARIREAAEDLGELVKPNPLFTLMAGATLAGKPY